MHFHTGNFCFRAVPNVYVSIFLTKKQIKKMKKQYPQLGFTFIRSLDVVLLMVEFYWMTTKYVTCVNKNFHQITLQKNTPEKSSRWWRQNFLFSCQFLHPSNPKLDFHLPHVRTLGTNHCGSMRRTALKWRELFQDVLCRCDYSERVVARFAHQIK